MLLATVPHSGEKIPDLCFWLKDLDPIILLSDVDRFVHELYAPGLQALKVPTVICPYHRYAVDLNREPTDVDQSSVEGAPHPPGVHSHGFHWVTTMDGKVILSKPMTQEVHLALTKLIYEPFHKEVVRLINSRRPGEPIFHIDLHSMPSIGTFEHRDPGEPRADVVISDQNGVSASPAWVDRVMTAFLREGFKVQYNWPYLGGRITQRYGAPWKGVHTVQVELNRSLYMNEKTKEKSQQFDEISKILEMVLKRIASGIF